MRKLLFLLCLLTYGAVFASAPWRVDVPVRDLDSLAADTLQPASPPASALAPAPAEAPSADTSRASGAPADTVASPATATPGEPAAAQAGTAELQGVVTAEDDGKPLEDVLILLQRDGLRLSARSDADGLYRLRGIPPGTWTLAVFRKGYEPREPTPETFAPGEARALELRLGRRILKGQVVHALAQRKAGSAQDVLAKRQKAAGVMEGVSAEQMAKSTDSDAGAVARRVTGTSLVGGKYVYVRGLGERYTNMTLNGLPVPSPEKEKRVVPQDLFPAGSLESFAIYKTFVPDLYADFAGGSVALVTKDIPEKGFLKFNLASGNHYHGRLDTGDFLRAYRTEAPKNGRPVAPRPAGWQTGDRRLTYDGGNTFWGFDDGTRSLPDGFPGVIPKGQTAEQAAEAISQGKPGFTPEERARFALALENVYRIDTGTISPPANLSLSAGNVYPGVGGGRFGFLLHAGFKNKHDQYLNERQNVNSVKAYVKDTVFHPVLKREVVSNVLLVDTLDTPSGKVLDTVRILRPGIAGQIDQGTYDAQLSGMLNMRYANPDWSVWWKNFAINIGTDKALLTRSYQVPGGAVSQDKAYEERYLLEFSRRSLIASQVGGEAYVGKGLLDSLTWAAGLSAVAAESPDSRRYLYSQSSLDTNQALQYANNDIWGTRIFEELSEKAFAARADGFLLIPPEYSARDTFFTDGGAFSHLALPTFNAGLAFNVRSRSFDATRYSYDRDRSVVDGKTLEEIRDPALLQQDILGGFSDFATSPKEYDTYDATEAQGAAYLGAAVSARLLRMPAGLDGGLRLEWYDFRLRAPYTGQDSDLEDRTAKVQELTGYPTFGTWLQPWSPLKLRLQYARTAVRPEIREMAPYQYSDYITGRTVEGNPDLRKTTVVHYDARADWFLPFQQSLSASLFFKDFTDPVETVIDNNRKESYQNAHGAYVKGVEFEANLSPGRLLEAMGIGAAWLHGLRLSGNYALMESEVRIRADSTRILEITSYKRPMVGQAPYLINASVSHEAETRRFGFLNAVLFNMAGERIRYTGVQRVPDIMEKPFASLESLHRLTWLKRNELSLRVKNWLRQSKELRVREYNDGKDYHSVTPEQREEVFGTARRYHTVERAQDALWVEVAYSRQL